MEIKRRKLMQRNRKRDGERKKCVQETYAQEAIKGCKTKDLQKLRNQNQLVEAKALNIIFYNQCMNSKV